MIYYPVIIPTLNRYEHFKRCVESLSRNTHAEKTELIIGLDYPPSEKYREGYGEICEYVNHISGFKKVTVLKRETNYGAVKNARDLNDYAFKDYDAVIYTEDDNEFSPCFLDFMDKVLNTYKNDIVYSSASGYVHSEYENLSKSKLILTSETNAWGFGKWRDKEKEVLSLSDFRKMLYSCKFSWKCFKAFPASFNMLISMVSQNKIWGDVMRSNTNALLGHYQIRPNVSLVRNWGYDGSGLHCGKSPLQNQYQTQTISTAPTYDIGHDMPTVNFKIVRANRELMMPKDYQGRIRFYLRVLKTYILFRIRHNR